LLRESRLIPGELKPKFAKVEEALQGPIKVIPESLSKAETFKILGKTTTIPKTGTFALYKIKPKYLKPSARLERAIKKQMKENIYFGGDVTKELVPQVAIKLKPKKYLVIGKKEAGLFFMKEAKKEGKYGVRVVGGTKTPFAKTFAEQKPVLVKLPKIPKPSKPTTAISEVKPLGIETPLMVGGVGLKTLPKPSYTSAEMEIGAVFMPSIVKPVVTLPTEKVKLEKPIVTEEKIKLLPVLKPSEKFKYETGLELKRVTIPKFREALVPRGLFGERLIPREALTSKQIQVQREALRQAPVIKPTITQRPRPPRKTPSRLIPIIKFPRPRPKKPIPKLRKPVPKVGYTFEIRRKGKWQRAKIPYAFATKKGAEYMARKKVLKEAAASYKIVKAKKGKKVVRSRMKAGPKDYLFRPGKEKGVMVQKKLLRILTPGEKKEISYAGGLAKMKKTQPGFFKQPLNNQLKRRKKIMAKKRKKSTRKKKKR